MANKLQELREKRAAAAATIQALATRINDEKRDFRSDERPQWERVNAEYDRLTSEVRAAEVDAEQRRRVGDPDVGRDNYDSRGRRDNVQHTEEQRSLAFRSWIKFQMGKPLTEAQEDACRELRFNPGSREMRIPLFRDDFRNQTKDSMQARHHEQRMAIARKEFRANLSSKIGSSGGYLVPPGTLTSAFELNLLAFGGVRQVAEEITTTSGEPLLWPTVDDTGNQGEQLGENTSVGSGTNPSFGLKRWDAYKFSSKPVLIPSELLDDDQYDVAEKIGEMLGIRIGRVTASKYATGSGASTPEGIVTGASLGVTAASATAISPDEIFNLVHSIDPAYRGMPGVGFLMHDAVILHVRKLKDGEGRFIWAAGLQDNVPDKLLGYPVQFCQEMASSVATGNKTIVFGALRQYKIRRVNDVRMYRLEERYRDLDQDGFLCFTREDGKLLSAGTAPVKYLQQA